MRIFLCAGEPSGDLHGANLVRTLRKRAPDAQCVGFGGERMQGAGCELLYPLCSLAVMGLGPVLASMHRFLKVLLQADRYFQRQRPDAVVLIDFPGFNWWMARRAHFHGIPVIWFVPPQLWAWLEGRVKRMRRSVDKVLCCLPFEEPWYHARGVAAEYVGHPYFDELAQQRLDALFLQEHFAREGKIIGLLPGSRTHEVHDNLPDLIAAARLIHTARPQTHYLVACFKAAHHQYVTQYVRDRGLPFIEPCLGRTPEIIHVAHACMAVSGSVGLELLYHEKPSVVLYTIRRWHLLAHRLLIKCRYISLVNLLAGEELFPEFMTARPVARQMADHVLGWLEEGTAYQSIRNGLAALKEKVAEPGACERAAGRILDLVGQRTPAKRRRAA
jgi:lipid-A-disaccharide synthase